VQFYAGYEMGLGLLVRDRRTMITKGVEVLDLWYNPGRPYRCRMADGRGPTVRSAEVHILEHDPLEPFIIVRLEQDLPGEPLPVSKAVLALGDEVLVPLGSGAPTELPELARTTVSSVARTVLTVAAPLQGTVPVLDLKGGLVGLRSASGEVVRATELLGSPRVRPRPFSVLPHFGLRMEMDATGDEDGAQSAVVIDLGLVLQDQLAIVLRTGLGFGERRTITLPAPEGLGPGVATSTRLSGNFSLEGRYRLSAGPTYLDLVLGGRYTVSNESMADRVWYSGDPNCDPTKQACSLTSREAPPPESEHFVGPTFGVDLRVNLFTMGYRFVPGALSYGFDNVHALSFGISIF